MSDEVVIRHCAPTLASIKAGSLFTSRFESEEAMRRSLRGLNQRLRGKGLMAIPLRWREGVGLIYLYRPHMLEKELQQTEALRLLAEFGYTGGQPAAQLRHLAGRLHAEEGFPHEIGLFLSYPPEDVDGFIRGDREAKCCGAWKVYGDVRRAQRTFESYKRCTSSYMSRWQQGWSIEQLIAHSQPA